MGLLAPWGLALLALLGPVIAMYLLKRRREEVVVSSTLLWERLLLDVEANAPWQRLRRNLLLILQLLALLLLAFAAARPFLPAAGTSTESLILIVDSSISMAATDGQGGGTRLDTAREEALRLAEQLPDNGRMTVIRAGGGAEVLVAATRDRQAVAQALAALRPDAADSDLTAALSLAAAIAAREPESEIVLLSDGVVTGRDAGVPVRYVALGTGGENQAISALSLRPQGQGYALFVQVTNYASRPASRRLAITVDGAPYAVLDLEMGAGEGIERVVEDLPAGMGQVRAALQGTDLLAADDTAWAVAPPLADRTIRLVTPGNVFLRAGLGLLPGVQLSVVAPGSEDGDTEDVPTLIVLDRVADDSVALGPATGSSLLLIAPPAPVPSLGISVTGAISQPVPAPATADDPLLRYVDLSDVAIAEAQEIPLPSWARPVIVDARTGAPLLWIGQREGRRIAMLAFDLHASDLALQVAFPLLLANLSDALMAGPSPAIAPLLGQPVALQALATAGAAEVRRPDGTVTRLEVTGAEAVLVPTQIGIYEIRWPAAETPLFSFAVNLFNPQESRLAPAPTLDLARAGGTGSTTTAPVTETEGRLEIWRWLALGALAVLMLEWLVSQRDGVVRLRQLIRGRAGA